MAAVFLHAHCTHSENSHAQKKSLALVHSLGRRSPAADALGGLTQYPRTGAVKGESIRKTLEIGFVLLKSKYSKFLESMSFFDVLFNDSRF